MSNGSGSAQISPLFLSNGVEPLASLPSSSFPLSLYLGVKNSGVVTAFVTLSAYHHQLQSTTSIPPTIGHRELVRLPVRPSACSFSYSLGMRCAYDAPSSSAV